MPNDKDKKGNIDNNSEESLEESLNESFTNIMPEKDPEIDLNESFTYTNHNEHEKAPEELIDKLNAREDTNNIYNYNNDLNFVIENEKHREEHDLDTSVSEEDDETYSLDDDGLKTYEKDGKVIKNYDNEPEFKKERPDFVDGNNNTLVMNGYTYTYSDDVYLHDDIEADLVNHCYERLENKLGMNNSEKTFSVKDYKKAMLNAMSSREFKEYYVKEISVLNIFDGRNYTNLGYKIVSAFDEDLNGSHEKLRKTEVKKPSNEIEYDKNNIKLIHNEANYVGSFYKTSKDLKVYSSISGAIESFRRMESYCFNKLVGGGEARFASKSVLNKVSYRNHELNFDDAKVSSIKSCITDEEIALRYLGSISDYERDELYKGIDAHVDFISENNTNIDKDCVSGERASSVYECMKTLALLKKNNKGRFFLNRWFSSSSSKEKEMIDKLKTGLKIYGLSDDSVNKIKNGDLDEMEKVREELDRKNKIFNERFGIVSEEEAVEKIRTNLLNKEVNANNDLHNEIKNELNEEKIDNKEEKIKEEIEEKEIMKESDLLK